MIVLKLDTDSVQALREAIQSVFVQHDAPLPDHAHVGITINLNGYRELFDALTEGLQTRDYVDVAKPFRAATINGYTSDRGASVTLLTDLTGQEALDALRRKYRTETEWSK